MCKEIAQASCLSSFPRMQHCQHTSWHITLQIESAKGPQTCRRTQAKAVVEAVMEAGRALQV